jgi:hypothetical protein
MFDKEKFDSKLQKRSVEFLSEGNNLKSCYYQGVRKKKTAGLITGFDEWNYYKVLGRSLQNNDYDGIVDRIVGFSIISQSIDDMIKYTLDNLKRTGGSSVIVQTGWVPNSGYSIALWNSPELRLPFDKFTLENNVEKWFYDNAETSLDFEGVVFGSWLDDAQNVCLDASEILIDRATAIETGYQRDKDAIYDLSFTNGGGEIWLKAGEGRVPIQDEETGLTVYQLEKNAHSLQNTNNANGGGVIYLSPEGGRAPIQDEETGLTIYK